jgi:DNA-binding GntR family transcriptional regulator
VPVSDAPFSRPSLREQIKDVILQRIVAGEYRPGARIVETRIAQELGVSQAPVREALRDLEQLGCIVHEPFRGCSVRAFSAEELLEAFPVRAALEALAARLAAERITEGELLRLAELIDVMRAAARRGDAHDQSQANAAFHATIVGAARNATLQRQWSLLEPFSRTYISVSRPGLDLLALSERHVPILEALRSRDPDAAADAMHEHLMGAADLLRPQRSGDEPKARRTRGSAAKELA